MSSVHNSVETVNAAATAIVTAEIRVQPSTIQDLLETNVKSISANKEGAGLVAGRRRWGSFWSLYWCFGSHKHSKRIGHAVLVPEPSAPASVVPVADNLNHSATILFPFIAPPSSPTYFLQSDPPSAIQSPSGLLSLTSLSINAYSPGGTASIFTVGPYAHETQLVSPPVLSTFTTEPSTASFTPPPEPVQTTTPSSPEVPFAQLLTSSLARDRRNSWTNLKFSLSQYEFKPYQYPGSPVGHSKSPGSAFSTSGTSSPFPDKCPVIEFRIPKFLGYEHFSNRKWGSRVGSGSLTPSGWGSRLGSGTLTPNGGISRLGSGTLTPNGGEPPSRDSHLLESEISEVASLANSDSGSQDEEVIVDHRVSFELTGEDIPTCVVKESDASLKIASETLWDKVAEGDTWRDLPLKNMDVSSEYSARKTVNEVSGMDSHGKSDKYDQKHRTISLGSSKDFNFDNTKGEVLDKSTINCEWWTNDKDARKELSQNNWTFFSMLQPWVN